MSHENARSPIQHLSDKYFELLLVTMVLTGTLVLHHLVSAKYLMLHFYYLPLIVAAHYFGRRLACTTAMLAFLVVSVFAFLDPSRYGEMTPSPLVLGLTICTWGAFLGLNAILLGTLCDQRAAHIKELREAHVGIIEILSKYLQAADQYTKSHSMRVADLAEAVARELRLDADKVENVRVGALLHDIGKVEVSTRLIQKAADLTDQERTEIAAHTFHGAELVRSLGSILQGAIPAILHHHRQYSEAASGTGDEIPIEARIVTVADAYDAIVTDRAYRRGRTRKEAIAVIRENAGTQFDPQVVAAFERVLLNSLEEEEVHSVAKTTTSGVSGYPVCDPQYNIEVPSPSSEPQNDTLAERRR